MIKYLKKWMGKRMRKPNGQEVIDFLNDKWHGACCPLCGGSDWNVSEGIFELRGFNDGKIVLGGNAIFPVIPVTCNKCGNTVFISALATGLMKE